MSYGNTFQSRLGFNFDINKLGSAIDPDGDLDQRLARQSNLIKENTATVYTAIASSNVANSTYFQNPLAPIVGSIVALLPTIYSTIWNYSTPINDPELGTVPSYILRPIAGSLTTTYNALLVELTENDSEPNGTAKAFNTFISHTERLSNLRQANKSNRPSFGAAQSISRKIQTLVYQTETTSISTVGALGLGAFTSLFIVPDLTAYKNAIDTDLAAISALLAPAPTTATPAIVSAVGSANANLVNLLAMLNTRRIHDENFYQNASSIVQDLSIISSNKNMADPLSSESNYLIDNLIGTTALKNL